MAKEKSDPVAPLPEGGASSPKANFKAEIPKDGLGPVGSWLSSYHVGDLTGLLGLFLTWLAYKQAKAAKSAAQKAAETAIKNRDHLEMATLLSDLSGRLRTIRDIYNSSTWDYADPIKDNAVSLAVEIRSTEFNNIDLTSLMKEIEIFLRDSPRSLLHIKDEEKRDRAKSKLIQKTIKFADSVDAMKLQKVKHGA